MRRYGGSTRLERRPAEGQTRLNTRRRLLPLKQSTRRAGEGRWCQAAAQAGCREREGREGRQAWAGAHRRINLEGEKECAVRACLRAPPGPAPACVRAWQQRASDRGGAAPGRLLARMLALLEHTAERKNPELCGIALAFCRGLTAELGWFAGLRVRKTPN